MRLLSLVWIVVGGLVAVDGLRAQGATAPTITAQPADATTNVGGAASFRVETGGVPPVNYQYQWSRDGQSLTGATGDVLVIPTALAADAGRYAVQVSGAGGQAVSGSALLTVQPAPTVPIVDPAFRGDPAIAGDPTAMLPLADGRVLLATSLDSGDVTLADPISVRLVRLLSDGRIDPAFRRGIATTDEFEPQESLYPPRITQLIVQTDGKILVAGHFIAFNGVRCRGLVRLTTGGEVDPGFTAPAATPAASYRSVFAKIALQADGKILLLNDVGGGFVRLLANGQTDAFFVPATSGGVVVVGAGGRIYVGSGGPRGPAGSGRVTVLRDDGSMDPAFSVYTCDPVQHLFPLPDGGVVVSTQYDRGPFTSPRFPAATFRLRADGTRDPAFGQRDAPAFSAPAPDGSLLLQGKLIAADGMAETSPKLGVGYNESFGIAGDDQYFNVFGPDGRLWIAGPFTVYNGVATSHIAHLNLNSTESPVPPRVLAAWSEPATIRLGGSATARVAPVGPGPLTYTWTFPGSRPVVTTVPSATYTPISAGPNQGFSVTVANSAGAAPSVTVAATVLPAALRIVAQPRRVSLSVGRRGLLGLELYPTNGASRYEWRRNGVVLTAQDVASGLIARMDERSLSFGLVSASQAGTYTLTLWDEAGLAVASDPMVVTVGDSSRFINLSTRAQIGSADQAAILGFVIPTGQYREVLLRGIGPSLAAFGVTGALAESRLELFDVAGRAIARTKSWGTDVLHAPQAADFEAVGAFALPPGSHDAALSINLAPGSYTARLSGLGGVEGTGLIELYEHDDLSDRLINLSARVLVAGGGNAIAGFAIRGPVDKRVLVRAAGPALGAFGVGGALGNPRLEIRAAAGALIAANDDWQTQSDSVAVSAATAAVGAFALANGSKDAALVVALPPGNYSAVITGTGSESGVTLVEVYELP